MRTDIRNINETTSYTGMTEGLMMFVAGNSREFNTGEWRNFTPIWHVDKCKQCLLCTPVCPDSCIPVADGKREAFDLGHCKGCGICEKTCPFGAISMEEGITGE